MLGCGILLVVVDWILLQSENATTKEMNQIYRWNFDIRLGMYSPELRVCSGDSQLLNGRIVHETSCHSQ